MKMSFEMTSKFLFTADEMSDMLHAGYIDGFLALIHELDAQI